MKTYQTKTEAPAARPIQVAWLVLVCLVVAAVGGSLAYVKLTHKKLLSVQSGSMEPGIRKGDLVVASPVARWQDLAVGEVVTFTNPKDAKSTITHRIVGVDAAQRKLQTKGDANEAPDAPISPRSVVGRVDKSIPYAGHVVDFIRRPIGLLILIYVPALFVVGKEIRSLTDYFRTQQVYMFGRRLSIGAAPGGKRKRVAASQLIVAGVVGSAVLAQVARAALSSTAALSPNSISTVAIPDVYEVCMMPANENLLSYALEDALFPEQPDPPLALSAPIIPGSYRVTARSEDHHLASPFAPNQLNERWFAQLYGQDAAAPPLYTTGTTDDLPRNQDSGDTVVNERLEITASVHGIRYVHDAFVSGLEIDLFGGSRYDDLTFAEQRQVMWNSIHPGCLTFERLGRATPEPEPIGRIQE